MSHIRPYPKYKETAQPWLGSIPSCWDLRRCKYLFRYRKELNYEGAVENVLSLTLRGVVNNDPNNPEGLVPQDYKTYQIFEKNDLVFKLIDLENLRTSRVGLVHEDGIMSPAYIRLTPDCEINVKYFFYQFYDLYLRGVFNQLGSGVRATLGPRDLLDLYLALPSLDEQTAIVRFLDHIDCRIKRYIHAKQKLIKLLNEQKQAIIHQAVTRGLEPDVRLKPSGVDWLGDVPDHWEIRRVKQVAQILRGKFSHRPRNDPSLYDGNYPFIQTGDVARATMKIKEFKQTLNDQGLSVSKMFPAGTLVMTIAANIGDVAVLDFEACFPDSIVGFVPQSDINRDFLYYIFRAMKPEFLREAPVNTQGNLNIERIGTQQVAIPPKQEQMDIVRTIEERTSKLNQLVGDSKREIDLLKEFHMRLIADVVTGKKDVREAAGQLPEELDEIDLLDEAPLEGEEDQEELEPVVEEG